MDRWPFPSFSILPFLHMTRPLLYCFTAKTGEKIEVPPHRSSDLMRNCSPDWRLFLIPRVVLGRPLHPRAAMRCFVLICCSVPTWTCQSTFYLLCSVGAVTAGRDRFSALLYCLAFDHMVCRRLQSSVFIRPLCFSWGFGTAGRGLVAAVASSFLTYPLLSRRALLYR